MQICLSTRQRAWQVKYFKCQKQQKIGILVNAKIRLKCNKSRKLQMGCLGSMRNTMGWREKNNGVRTLNEWNKEEW